MVEESSDEDKIRFDTGGTERMVIDSSGIDINGNELILDADADTSITASTDDQIDFKVGGSDTVHMGLTTYNASDRIVLTNTSGNASMAIVAGTSGESSVFMADGTSGDASYRGYVQYQHTNDNMNFGTAGAERMRILSDGKVGIGKTDPNYPLVVAGTNPKIQIYDSAGSGQTNLYFGDSGSNLAGYVIYQHSDDRMRIGTNATDVIDILSSGHVGIGSDSPSADLYVQSPDDSTCLFAAGGTYAFGINRQGASGTNYGWYQGTTGSNTWVVYDGGGTGRFEVSLSSAGFISDRDQKENITDLAYGLETVKKLKPKKFKFKDVEEMEIGDIDEEEQENKEKRILEGDYNIGFIAQEMVEEVPEIVSGTDGQGDMKIDYAAFTSVLTKAIQEQQVIIDDLKARITTLEGS
jgi:hypothetical protein